MRSSTGNEGGKEKIQEWGRGAKRALGLAERRENSSFIKKKLPRRTKRGGWGALNDRGRTSGRRNLLKETRGGRMGGRPLSLNPGIEVQL